MRHGRATAAILVGVALLLIGNLLFRALEPRRPAHHTTASPSRQAARPPPAAPSLPPLVLYVFATFTDGSTLGEGLHVLVSSDGLAWKTLQGDPILLPQGRLGTVFRDPSIVWHGGWFHLAFTTELCVGLQRLGFDCVWETRTASSPPARFGYARSRDLLVWQDVSAVAVPLEHACNVWAPDWHLLNEREALALGGGAMVVFSAIVASPCPPNFGPGARGHRMRPYFMTTADFRSFSAPRLLFDPGESAIDTTLFRAPPSAVGVPPQSALYAVFKSEQNECARWRWDAGGELRANRSCTLALRLARAPSALGPFAPAPLGHTPFWTDSLSRQCVEGPTVLRVRQQWLVIFDGYRRDCPLFVRTPSCRRRPGLTLTAQTPVCAYQSAQGFGALRSDNLQDWQDVSDEVRLPSHHKHGTALRLRREALCSICAEAHANSSTGGLLWRAAGVLELCSGQRCGQHGLRRKDDAGMPLPRTESWRPNARGRRRHGGLLTV